jgi:rhodanese-related sulfurtransferase
MNGIMPYDIIAGGAMVRRVLYETTLILLMAIILAFGSYFARPEALSKKNASQPGSSNGDAVAHFEQVSIETAKTMYANNQAIFADARSRTAYQQGHIEGAIHLDPFNYDDWSSQLTSDTPPQQIFITYCDGPNCPLARQLAEKLSRLGFERVYYLVDGWEQWRVHNLPTTSGD